MTEAITRFTEACKATLAADPGSGGRRRIAALLEEAIADPAFVAACFESEEPGRRELYRDPELGFCLLAYDMDAPRISPPHDHGVSWAVYGQVSAHTEMTEYERLGDRQGPGAAELRKLRTYRLDPGNAGLYDVGCIHAINYPAGARFLRVTGQDLESVPRLKFDLETSEAKEISSTTVPG
jgi:hypothetical protein